MENNDKTKKISLEKAVFITLLLIILVLIILIVIVTLNDNKNNIFDNNNFDFEIDSNTNISINNSILNNTTLDDNNIIEIQFKDTNFYNAIKKQVSNIKEFNDTNLTISLSNSDIENVESLIFTEFTGSSIKDITGIRYFTSLKKLTLQDSNYLTDISELAYLTNLEQLYIDNNKKISDLSPISGLTNLTKLDLDYSNSMQNINNINALANLINLEYLDTSVYNMDYTVDVTEGNIASFDLPAIFSAAQSKGASINSSYNLDCNIITLDSKHIEASINTNSTVTLTIAGSVFDKITCNINFIIK